MKVLIKELSSADLIVDTVYEEGTVNEKNSGVLSKLMPRCSNSDDFRRGVNA